MSQTFNRRTMLRRLATATIATAVPVAAVARTSIVPVDAPQESPGLVTAYRELTASIAERKAATDALDWLAAEYRHLWPLAPEELLSGANAHRHDCHNVAERDIAGRYIMRDVATMTKTVSRRFREANVSTGFSVDTSDQIKEWLERWRANTPKGRTATALARATKRRRDMIDKLEGKLALAKQYEAEKDKLTKASDALAMRDRWAQADRRFILAVYAIERIPALTMTGVWMKADAKRAWSGVYDGRLDTMSASILTVLPAPAFLSEAVVGRA